MYRTEVRKADGTLVFASDRLTVAEAEADVSRNIHAGALMRREAITTDAPIRSPFVRRALAVRP